MNRSRAGGGDGLVQVEGTVRKCTRPSAAVGHRRRAAAADAPLGGSASLRLETKGGILCPCLPLSVVVVVL